MRTDLYTKVVLTIIAASLVWICVCLTAVGTPVEAQATSASSRVLIAGWVDSGGAVHNLDQALGVTPGLPVTLRTPTPSSTQAEAPAVPATAPRALGVVSQPQTPPPSAPSQSRIQCQATTQKGAQCKRLAEAGKRYCWQHGGR